MAEVVILGAGVSGHTAALHLRRLLGREHKVTVVSPNSQWNWIPSNIWVGVGGMAKKDVVFPLAPVYARKASASVRPRRSRSVRRAMPRAPVGPWTSSSQRPRRLGPLSGSATTT
jgi:sulfide:quinone oxidoreductase